MQHLSGLVLGLNKVMQVPWLSKLWMALQISATLQAFLKPDTLSIHLSLYMFPSAKSVFYQYQTDILMRTISLVVLMFIPRRDKWEGKKKGKAEMIHKKSFSLLNREHYPGGPKISHLLTQDGDLAEKVIPVVWVWGQINRDFGLGLK